MKLIQSLHRDQSYSGDFWLPVASGGAALEANITVVLLVLLVLLMPFTQNLISSLFVASALLTINISIALLGIRVA